MLENVLFKGLQREFPFAYSSKAPPTALLLATFRGVLLWRNMQGYLRREAGICFVAGGANRVHTSAAGGGSFLVAGGANRVPIFAARGWEFFGAGGANRVPIFAARAGSSKTPTPQAGWAVVGDCGSIIGAQRILYARNVGGLNNLVLAQEEQ